MTNSHHDQAGNNVPQVRLNAQYIKDLSFENPNSPMSLIPSASAPNVEIDFNISSGRFDQENFEVVMHADIKVKNDKHTLFILDIQFAGAFSLVNIAEEQIEHTLMVYCSYLLFPYFRRIISDVTRDGGFQPLMLEPIDFESLHQQRKVQSATAAQA